MKKAIVIGAGIGGMASALRLRKLGYEVKVIEANAFAGGKISEIRIGDFRFDAGPSLFTLPEQVDDLFKLFGKKPSDYFEYEKLDVVTKYFYPDGTELKAYAEPERFAREVAEKLGEKPETLMKFLKKSKQKYDLTGDLFLKKSLHKASTFLNAKALKAFLHIPQLDIFRTMHQANTDTFEKEETVQLFDRYATYNGSDPYQAPAILNIIPHLEHSIGAFFPKKGMYEIVRALLKLSEEQGVSYLFKARVKQILTEGKKASGIIYTDTESNEHEEKADLIVCNADIGSAYRKLMPKEKAPEAVLAQPPSSSALIFYWGIGAEFKSLDLHNIFFSGNYKKEFDCIFKQKTLSNDPTVYIFISKRQCSADAPEGKENWFVMINTPPDSGQDWNTLITEARKNILHKLRNHLYQDPEPLIECEEVLDPRSIESRTSSRGGALYGNSSNNRYAAFYRHGNESQYLKNLYFCGGSVHPGGGIPLCLLSAKITADLIARKR